MEHKSSAVWVLADDRAGNVSQALGVADAFAAPYEVKNIVYDKYGGWPNIIRASSLFGVDLQASDYLGSPWPDLVIGAGRKTGPVARYIKRNSGGKTLLVQLMWPGMPYRDFDLVFTPKHDAIAPGGRVFNTVGAPNRVTQKLLAEKKEKWAGKFEYLPDPKVALLVGGDTKIGQFTVEHARELAEKVSLFMADSSGSLLITSSRRTSAEVLDVLKKEIKHKFYLHDYYSLDENPYFGFLACCDVIIAGGDSISMCSEACSTGKPVFIYSPEDITPQKHQDFHANLYDKNYARPLSGGWDSWEYEPLDDAGFVARVVRGVVVGGL